MNHTYTRGLSVARTRDFFIIIIFIFLLQSVEASQWRVCYQWGQPRLVSQPVGSLHFQIPPKTQKLLRPHAPQERMVVICKLTYNTKTKLSVITGFLDHIDLPDVLDLSDIPDFPGYPYLPDCPYFQYKKLSNLSFLKIYT